MRVAGLGTDAVANALPVILGRRRNTVPIVATPNLVRGLQLTQCFLYRRELGVGCNARVQGRSDVLYCAVDALHVLKQADHLGDWLGERVTQLFGDSRD